MSEWKEYKIKDLGAVVTGKTPSKNYPEDWGAEMPFITPSDFGSYGKKASSSERKLSQVGIQRLSNKVLPKNSILVTCIGSDMGKVVMNKVPAISNQQINAIIPDTTRVDNDFLYYRLVDLYDTLRIYGADGTAVPIVNKGDFENIDIGVAPLAEQRSIASVLSSLDDKIDLLQRQNKTLEAMAETLFRQWFMEEAKEEWEIGTLANIVEVDTGFAFESKYYENQGKLRVVRGKNVTIGNIRWGADARYYDHPISELEKYLLNKWDIVIGMDGSRVGQNRAIVSQRDLPSILAQRVARLRAKDSRYQPFVWKLIYSDDFQSFIEATHTGTSIPHISQKQILDYEIVIPPKQLIERFSKIILSFWDKSEINTNQIHALISLRDTLLPKLMSGEVRIITN